MSGVRFSAGAPKEATPIIGCCFFASFAAFRISLRAANGVRIPPVDGGILRNAEQSVLFCIRGTTSSHSPRVANSPLVFGTRFHSGAVFCFSCGFSSAASRSEWSSHTATGGILRNAEQSARLHISGTISSNIPRVANSPHSSILGGLFGAS